MNIGRLLVAAIAALLLFGRGLPAAHAHTLQEILDRQAFTICADPDALPFSSRAGSPPGFQIDLARTIAERLKVRLDVDWVVFRRSARKVDCDAIMSSVARGGAAEENELAEKTVPQASSRPYARQITRLVLRDGAPPIASLAEMKQIVVAVPPASYLHYLLDTHGIPVRTRYMTADDILDAVAKGEVAGGIVSDWDLDWYRKTHPDARISADNGLVLDPDLDYDVAVTLRKTDRALVEAVNGILAAMMADGGMAAMFAKYGIAYRPPAVR